MPAQAVAADEEAGHQQRVLFLETKKALERGDDALFQRNLAQLRDYPLYPYLLYWRMRRDLGTQSSDTIEAFLTGYPSLPITPLLRTAWLRHLAQEGRWEEFLRLYRHGGAEMQCYLHTAQLHSGKPELAWAGAKRLWLVGHSQDAACDELFQAWREAGGISRELYWQRIELVMARGNSGLARHLARHLDKEDQARITLWRRVYHDPTLIERHEQLQPDSAENRRIIHHGLTRLARTEPEQAITLWRKIQPRYQFSAEQSDAIGVAIARQLAYNGDPRALLWFAQLPPPVLEQEDRAWAARVALRNSNWKAAISWLDAMPVTERLSTPWQYWRARISAALGDEQQAEHLYFSVSRDRGYYGFLAADQINAGYNLEHTPVEVDDTALQALKERPEMVRAHELYMLLLTTDARREWGRAVAGMGREQRLVAGKLADEWRWYDTALLTLAKANYFSDLDIRFPLAHSESVTREAQSRQLNPAWVYAVARQESAMSPDARSPAGALGLMQLMPTTGKAVAKALNYPIGGNEQLLEPDTNIHLGTYYLRQVLDRFDNNAVLATAAYNAGPHRVSGWFPEQGVIDADIWVESMPFHETRLYVRRVMAYTVFYEQRLDNTITRLNQRMAPIGRRATDKPL
ncbi:MAG: transglycosylase SLT domain-containing protein [Gammaproteobacteria bacterium]|nr:transglycosylase SLT domain-containing protein [Gammaproteobacteria bacterium]